MSLLRFIAATGLLIVGAHQALADTVFTYTLADSKATITGFTAAPTPSGVLTIPATVDSYTVVGIAANAFQGKTNITGLSFTANTSFATIGSQAFKGCTEITIVTLPSGLLTIGASAFADCTKLTAAALPSTVTTIGDSAFQNDILLASVSIGATTTVATTVGANAFAGCKALASLTVTSGVTTIGASAFANADKLTTVTLPDTVTTVGAGAFANCDLLASITFGTGLTTLGDGFAAGCPKLATITVGTLANTYLSTSYASTAGVLFNRARTTLVLAPAALAGEYTVPTTVTTIGPDAFAQCSTLASVILPTGLTQISARAFSGAAGLTFIDFPAALTTIGASAFSGCTGLTAVTFPASLTTLETNAFNGASNLSAATFAGNAPATVGTTCFDGTAAGFTVYYSASATGFTSPTWMGYTAVSGYTPALAAPTVTTGAVTARRTSAVVSGSIPSANGSSVTARGFVYNTTGNPSLGSGTTVTVGTGTGYFTTSLTGLSANTTYYVRSYATNGVGTNYGTEVSLTTLAALTAPVVTSVNGTIDTTPTLVGKAEAGATVSIKIGSAAAVTVTADATGAWSYTVPTALTIGRHTIVITATDYDGNTQSTTFTQSILGPTGFAAATYGGSAGTEVVVTTREDFITYATSTNAYVINVSGQLDVGTVAVKSGKTIQGVDANSGLQGCLSLSSVGDIIIRGLNLSNPAGRALQITNSQLIYVTHCTFLNCSSEQIDISYSDLITFSWCEFASTTAGQVAMKVGREAVTDTPRITLHHNWWSGNLASGLPAAASGYVHQFSNYVNPTGSTAGTALSGSTQLLSEGNHFKNVANPLTKTGTAVIRAFNNVFTSCTGTTATTDDAVFTPGYSYEIQATADLATVIPALAGNTSGAAYDDPDIGSATITIPSTASTAVAIGTSITLSAVPKDVTASSHQWRLANVPISGATSATYTISSMSSTNAGKYTVAIGLADGSTVVSVPLVLTAYTPTSSGGSSGGGGACGLLFPAALALLALRRRRA